MIPDRKQQLFQLTCLREARRLAKAGQKLSPIKLRSLKDVRFQAKSTRPESATTLSESYSKFNSLHDELRKRTVISLSPTAFYEQFVFSPRSTIERPALVNENKEESPAPMFNDFIKPNLPEIDEMRNLEDVVEEEKNCGTRVRHQNLGERVCQDKVIADGLGKTGDDVGRKSVVGRREQGIMKIRVRKPLTSRGIVKRRTEDVLEFKEEGKMKKKLTKSQERGLLNRLQGFSTKFLNNNK